MDDFTGDGKPEILTANSFEDDVSLFVSDGMGGYGDPAGETIGYVGGGPFAAPMPTSIAEVADLNGDGRPDLLLVENGLGGNLPSQPRGRAERWKRTFPASGAYANNGW